MTVASSDSAVLDLGAARSRTHRGTASSSSAAANSTLQRRMSTLLKRSRSASTTALETPLESYFSLYPPSERGVLDPARELPKVVRTHDDVAACLEAYRGPTLDSYPVRVLINYIDWKLHTGKTDEQVVSKLELLELRFPSYVHAFAMVRDARRLGPSDVIPMAGLTPLDRTAPNVMAALRAEPAIELERTCTACPSAKDLTARHPHLWPILIPFQIKTPLPHSLIPMPLIKNQRRFRVAPYDVRGHGGSGTSAVPIASKRRLPEVMKTRRDVIYCLELYPGVPSDMYPGEVVLRYLDLKKRRGKTQQQIEAKLERLERLRPQFAQAYAFARYGRGLGPSRVLSGKWPAPEDELPPATPPAADDEQVPQPELFTDTDGSVHIVRYFVEPAPLGARALSLLTMDSLFETESEGRSSYDATTTTTRSDSPSARSDSPSGRFGGAPQPVDTDEYRITVPFRKVRGRKM
ncbi:hypothetical protein Q8F55_008202 [Vanrija albida]|uniref:Uncharacterized protein n=1 Tax=Vanrija albida TaxID=181172 RepID=A0ABR3PVQ5_9TREE